MNMLKSLCKLSLVVFFIHFTFSISIGQEAKLLVLEDAIDIALEKSYQMKSLRLSVIRSEENLIAAKGRFKTNADLSLDVPNWSETVSEINVPNALPVFNTTGRLRYQGMLDINQPLPTDGRLTFRSQVYHRDVSTYLTSLQQDEKRREMYTSLSLRFTQPLFTINRLKLGLQTANLNYERTSRIFKRSELNIIYFVTQSFFELYRATRQAEIARDNVTQQNEMFDLAQKKYNAGLIPEVEALRMEVELAQSVNDLEEAEGILSRSTDSFKQLIGLELKENIGVKTELDHEYYSVPEGRAVELALKYRAEIRERQIEVELAKIDVKEVDARSEIRGNVFAFYDVTGVSDPFLPYSSSPQSLWNSSLDDMDRRPNNRGVVFSLQVPLWDWGVNRAEVASAQAELNDSQLTLEEQKKTIVREVRDVIGRIEEARNRLDVLQKNQAVAQRTFDISLERFNNGDITSQDLALDRNRFLQAKFSFLNAYIDYKLAEADLRRKTMWDFKTNEGLLLD
jgi:outer membrane protein